MTKRTTTAIMAAIMTLTMGITSFAGQWNKDANGWWWVDDNGSYPVNEWRWLDGNQDGVSECYYFGADGYMLADTVTPDGYQVNADGAWTTDGAPQLRYSENTDNSQSDSMDENGYSYTSEALTGLYTSENGDSIVINVGAGDSLGGIYYNTNGSFEKVYSFAKVGTGEYKDSANFKSIKFLEDGSLFMNNRVYTN